MHFDIITLFPEMFKALECSIPGRAIERRLATLEFYNPREFTTNKHHTVDDKPYGGGPGMVMMAEPLYLAIQAIKQKSANTKVIYLTPQGQPLQQKHLIELKEVQELTVICGRYEGIDERIIESEVDEEFSIGDYVLSGGELAAMVMIDAIIRLLPGALGDETSPIQDSFYAGLLDYPHYTRPEEFNGMKVPSVLLSGNHQEIEQWRQKQALGKTLLKRPDLLNQLRLTQIEQELLESFIDELGESDEQTDRSN